MSDYTPITEDIREAYAWVEREYQLIRDEKRLEEFDRWLAEHDAQILADVVDAERKESKQLLTILKSILYNRGGLVEISDKEIMEIAEYGIRISEYPTQHTRKIELVAYPLAGAIELIEQGIQGEVFSEETIRIIPSMGENK